MLYRDHIGTPDGGENAVRELFSVLRSHHDLEVVRQMFAKYSAPPPAQRQIWIRNLGLLDALDRMKPKPVIQQLAFRLAAENKQLPREEQRGARGISPTALDKLIRGLVKARREHKAKTGNYWPYPDPGPDGMR